MNTSTTKLAWLDLETTGLSRLENLILQVGIIVTDLQLNELGAFDGVVHYPKNLIENELAMVPRVREMHTKTGLLDRVLASKLTSDDVEAAALAFLDEHFPYQEDGSRPLIKLAGSSVHFDVGFLREDMPKLAEQFHHRHLDVSALKDICHLWAPGSLFTTFSKEAEHNAIADNRYSIASLKHYARNLLCLPVTFDEELSPLQAKTKVLEHVEEHKLFLGSGFAAEEDMLSDDSKTGFFVILGDPSEQNEGVATMHISDGHASIGEAFVAMAKWLREQPEKSDG